MPRIVSIADSAREPALQWSVEDLEGAASYFAARLRFEIDGVCLWHLLQAGDPCTVIDVRSPRSFAAGHIRGALSLPLQRLDARAVAMLPAGGVVVCDEGCGRGEAYRAALRIVRFGREARVLSGGLRAWEGEGFVLEPSVTAPDLMCAI